MRTQLSMRAPLPLLSLTIGAVCLYVCVPSVVTTTPAQWHRIVKGGLLDGPDPGGHPAPAEILEAAEPWQALSEARTPCDYEDPVVPDADTCAPTPSVAALPLPPLEWITLPKCWSSQTMD